MLVAVAWTLASIVPHQGAGEPITEKSMSRHWIHAREEDADGIQVYRAKGSFAPRPSRFRMEYELKADGKCRYMWLSPSDGHQMKDGSWKLLPPPKPGEPPTLEVREGKTVNRFEVVGLSRDTMRLKPGNAP